MTIIRVFLNFYVVRKCEIGNRLSTFNYFLYTKIARLIPGITNDLAVAGVTLSRNFPRYLVAEVELVEFLKP